MINFSTERNIKMLQIDATKGSQKRAKKTSDNRLPPYNGSNLWVGCQHLLLSFTSVQKKKASSNITRSWCKFCNHKITYGVCYRADFLYCFGWFLRFFMRGVLGLILFFSFVLLSSFIFTERCRNFNCPLTWKNKNDLYLFFWKMMYFIRDAVPQRWGNLQMPLSRTEVRDRLWRWCSGLLLLFFIFLFELCYIY